MSEAGQSIEWFAELSVASEVAIRDVLVAEAAKQLPPGTRFEIRWARQQLNSPDSPTPRKKALAWYWHSSMGDAPTWEGPLQFVTPLEAKAA